FVGVDGVLATSILPVSSLNTITSVNVPPMSTPDRIMLSCRIERDNRIVYKISPYIGFRPAFLLNMNQYPRPVFTKSTRSSIFYLNTARESHPEVGVIEFWSCRKAV